MGKKILITGAQGFIGCHLLKALKNHNEVVQGPEFDLCDFHSILSILKLQPWDIIIHLAGLSHVADCEAYPQKAYSVNLCGTALLLEGIQRELLPQKKVHLIFSSSAQVYRPPEGLELTSREAWTEEREIQPQNVYAETKRQGEVIIQEFCQRSYLTATILRLFNHTHHTQAPSFFLPGLYRALQAMQESGPQELQIPVGYLDLYRDFGSLQDLMSAWLALVKKEPPETGVEIFNICSGTGKHLRTLAEELAKAFQLKVNFKQSEQLLRAHEPTWMLGNCKKFSEATGWSPQCKDEQSLIRCFLEKF